MNASVRIFEDNPAVRGKMPLLVGLMGPSGSGKTYSALRLAKGIQAAHGGEIYFIDTEARRALHYADKFTFRHIEFGAPFGSLDYLAALRHCVNKGAGVVIVDSMSHEHEGPGGLIDMHEQELSRLAGDDWSKRERMNMLAWQKPKANRRLFINGLLQLNANFIFCFRAKDSNKPMKVNGKTEIVPQGFVPIAGDEFVFEMTVNCLLLPNAKGVPTWASDNVGERMMIKLPAQFGSLFADNRALDEDIGGALALWAQGDHSSIATALHETARAAARKGKAALQALWKSLSKDNKAVVNTIMEELKGLATDAENAVADDPFADADKTDTDKPKTDSAAAPSTQTGGAGGAKQADSTAAQSQPPASTTEHRPATGPAEWTDAECAAHGRQSFTRGMTRKAALPPELRGEDQAHRSALVLNAFDHAEATANGQQELV